MAKKAIIASAAAATATVAAVAGKKMKSEEFCPICTAKRIVNKTRLNQTAVSGYGNGVALTPPMGWSSWNLFAHKINEDLIKEIADAMKASGLLDAGYQYVNIDDCWQSSQRDENGKLQCDKATFPNGIKALAEYVNVKGMKLGIYSSNGTLTCEDYPASLRHEAIDADTFASWGVEYFKYDFCHNVKISEKAPAVISIEVSREGEKPFAVFNADDFSLSGRARKITDEHCGDCIVGLCSRNGSLSVNVEVPEGGKYVLSLVVVKPSDEERFVRATVNGKEEYHFYAPKCNVANRDRRAQADVILQNGVNTIVLDNPVGSRMDSSAIQYKLMGRELRRATKEYAEKNGVPEKPIVFSLCEWGLNKPWKWGREAGNLWRTTPDIKPVWSSVLAIYEATVRLWKYSTIGAWNDPDMLEVGNGKFTFDENRSHFSLWCMLAAPLILGNDVRKFVKADGTVDENNKILKILTNRDMIAINQDALGMQCRRIKTGLIDILVKPLDNAKVAVCIFNKTNKIQHTKVDFKKISNQGFVNLPTKDSYKVHDVWAEIDYSECNCLTAETAPHGVRVYVVE